MTGLYAGEQDMFCFLIDPPGWTEIDGQAFAPGYFVWNSEVGCRSVGIETFSLSAACRKISVKRTTGTTPEEIRSARTVPGPTEGS